MNINDAVLARINSLCEAKNLPLNHLGNQCKIPQGAVNRVMRAGADADMAFIQTVCAGLGISVAEFFADPVFRGM